MKNKLVWKSRMENLWDNIVLALLVILSAIAFIVGVLLILALMLAVILIVSSPVIIIVWLFVNGGF